MKATRIRLKKSAIALFLTSALLVGMLPTAYAEASSASVQNKTQDASVTDSASELDPGLPTVELPDGYNRYEQAMADENSIMGASTVDVGTAWGLEGTALHIEHNSSPTAGIRVKLTDFGDQQDGAYEVAFRTGADPAGSIGFLVRYKDESNYTGLTIDSSSNWGVHYSKGLDARGNDYFTDTDAPALEPNTAYKVKITYTGDNVTVGYMKEGDSEYSNIGTKTMSGGTADDAGGFAVRINPGSLAGNQVTIDNVVQYDAEGGVVETMDFDDLTEIPAYEVRLNKSNTVNNDYAMLALEELPAIEQVAGIAPGKVSKITSPGVYVDGASPATNKAIYTVQLNGTNDTYGLVFNYKDESNYATLSFNGGWVAGGKVDGSEITPIALTEANIPNPQANVTRTYRLDCTDPNNYILTVSGGPGTAISGAARYELGALSGIYGGEGRVGVIAGADTTLYTGPVEVVYPLEEGNQAEFFNISELDMWYDEFYPDNSDPSVRNLRNWEMYTMMLGNGYMGALIYGGVKTEEMILNEKTLWQGGPGTREEGESDEAIYGNWSKAQEGLPQLREMFKDQTEVPTATAQSLLTNPSAALFREKHGSYQTMADMDLVMAHGETYTDYIRGVDLDTATSVVQYTIGRVTYQRQYFMSYPDNVLVAKITADVPGHVGFTLKLDGRQPSGYTVSADPENMTVTLAGSLQDWEHNENQGTVLNGNGMKYEAQAKLIPVGGTVTAGTDNSLVVTGADSVIILFTAGTDYLQDYSKEYKGDDPHEAVTVRISSAAEKSFDALRQTHLEDYQELYQRVNLNIGQLEVPTTATDILLDNYPDNSDAENRYIEALAFNVGRYLLISSSRAGSLPANLQGVWNALISPQWESDYHLNINMQMNYWMTDVLNMPELLEPVTDYMKDVQTAGTVTAREIYGYDDAWVMHNPMNPFGHTGLQAYTEGFWFPEASAWTLRQLIEHYSFTLDDEYLDEIYDLIEGNVSFWKQYLVVDENDGLLICSPTCLPEQGPFTQAGSMSQQIVLDLFENYLVLSEATGNTSSELYNWVQENIDNVDNGLRVDEEHGIIRDWKYKDSRVVSTFRHLNQMYALYPSNDLLFEQSSDSDLMKAAKTFLEVRQPDGNPWSLAWRAALQARLNQSELAYDALQTCIADTYYPNMFSTPGNVIQIDANLGVPAAMAEMLLQSHAGFIDVLPALPDEWPEGSFRDFVARGNFLVDVTWKNHVYETITITSRSGGILSVKLEDMEKASVTKNGAVVTFTPNSSIDGVYDLQTAAGDEIVIARNTAVKAAPVGVVATRDLEGNVKMEWIAVEGASSYIVRRYEGGRYTEMATTDSNSVEFADTHFSAEGADKNTSTQYVVSAVINGVETQYSAYAIPSVETTVEPSEEAVLIGHWSFNDENDRGANALEGGVDATIGSGITYAEGVDGEAALFNGTGGSRDAAIYMDTALVEADGNISSKNFSVSMWVKRTGGIQSEMTLIQLIDLDDVLTTGGSTKPPLQIGIDGTFNTSLRGISESLTGESEQGEWQHVVITVDSGHKLFTLYLNGEQVGQIQNFEATEEAGPLGLMFGMHRNNQRAFNGALDEIYCYHGVLTEDEIQRLYKREVLVTGVTLDQATLSLEEGETAMLTAIVAPENATNKTVTWTSSDETVATVVEGKVTAVATGTATITVTTEDGGKAAQCVVTVVDSDFNPDPAPDPKPETKPNDNAPFDDVQDDDWYAEAVQYVYDNGLMIGTGMNEFSPNGQTTRGTMVTVLYRQCGSPSVNSDGKAWWSDARAWAMESGISDGTNMDDLITREQLATMLYRYAKQAGKDVSANGDLNKFTDCSSVSDWAIEAVQWAVGKGILIGRPDGIAPKGLTTRAEVATMLMRFDREIR